MPHHTPTSVGRYDVEDVSIRRVNSCWTGTCGSAKSINHIIEHENDEDQCFFVGKQSFFHSRQQESRRWCVLMFALGHIDFPLQL